MTAVTGADFARLAEARRAEARDALERVKRLLAEHKTKRNEVASRYQEAADELARQLLPALDEPALGRAADLLAYPTILKWNLLRDRDADKAALAERIVAIERDPRYIERDLLLAPGVGKLVRALAEQRHFKEPYSGLLRKAAHPLLGRLLATGYGTDEYKVPFWRLSFYALWEAGDAIVERFPGKKTFGELRGELLEAQEAMESFDARINELQKEIGAVRALVDERQECATKLDSVDARWLATAHERIRHYLEDWAFKGLPGVAALPAGFEGVLKRASGLHASEQLQSRATQLEEEIGKLDREIMKFRRPKRAYAPVPAASVDRLRMRRAKDDKFFDRYRRTYDTVYVFDRYDRGSLIGDFLWWDAMTDGRIDGDFIPDVRDFRSSHPHYDYDSGHGRDAQAAAAVAEHDYGQGSGHDSGHGSAGTGSDFDTGLVDAS